MLRCLRRRSFKLQDKFGQIFTRHSQITTTKNLASFLCLNSSVNPAKTQLEGLPHVYKFFDFPLRIIKEKGRKRIHHWVWRVSPPFLLECDPSSLLASVNPTTPRTSLPRHCANLCCALNRCPNKPLSGGGGGGNLGPWGEKNAAIFMAQPWLPYSWGPLFGWRPPGSDTRFQRFRFPGLLKRSDEKGWRGGGWESAGAKSLRLCCAEAVEPCLQGPLPTQEVLC